MGYATFNKSEKPTLNRKKMKVYVIPQSVKAWGRSFLLQFEKFALRGNAIQIAIGVIIGNSFSKIIASFVRDIAMPPMSLLLGFFTFTDLKITLLRALYDTHGHIIRHAVELQIGSFIQSIMDFLIVTLCVFAAIKTTNSLYYKLENKNLLPEVLESDKEEKKIALLTQIRDLLLKQDAKKS